MPARSSEISYNTNLASEYLLMSLLCRAGKDAYLSLGNKKGVDIIVRTLAGAIAVVEVKGVNKANDWLICNHGKLPVAPNLFYALVCFQGRISELTSAADIWLIPSERLQPDTEHVVHKNGKTVYLRRSNIIKNYLAFKDTFESLNTYLETH
ncbi:hypothetical protein ACFS5N_13440 [Mucilaginibacter ximonensis]|uniref:NERD domain-containing protein n=1 Tax=Mucilaginibacter ximonensis TaxID=538021 RepID=A0ABW5YDP3_9SPHI